MSRNHHLICLPHHAPKIIDGTKTTTIRAPRSRQIAVGDTSAFARWTAKPYRSKQERVRVVTVNKVSAIRVKRRQQWFAYNIMIDGYPVSNGVAVQMAANDGFDTVTAMIDYLTSAKQPEFSGFIYRWET